MEKIDATTVEGTTAVAILVNRPTLRAYLLAAIIYLIVSNF